MSHYARTWLRLRANGQRSLCMVDITNRLLHSRNMLKDVRRYLSRLGKKGGASKSREKIAASRRNMILAHKAKRKYPPCPRYKNRSHRFAAKKGTTCACGDVKPREKRKAVYKIHGSKD